MKSDDEVLRELADELVNLWVECKTRCERIEELGKQLEGIQQS